jgi:hypothetical protein
MVLANLFIVAFIVKALCSRCRYNYYFNVLCLSLSAESLDTSTRPRPCLLSKQHIQNKIRLDLILISTAQGCWQQTRHGRWCCVANRSRSRQQRSAAQCLPGPAGITGRTFRVIDASACPVSSSRLTRTSGTTVPNQGASRRSRQAHPWRRPRLTAAQVTQSRNATACGEQRFLRMQDGCFAGSQAR